MKVENFRLHCQKHPDFEMMSKDGFIAGCHHYMTLNGNGVNSTIDISIDLNNSPDGKRYQVNSKIKNLDLEGTNAKMIADQFKLSVGEWIDVETKDVQISCEKEKQLDKVDFEKIWDKCLDRFDIKSSQIIVDDKQSKMKYFIYPDYGKIENGVLSLHAPRTEIVGDNESTTLFNFKVSCLKDWKSKTLNLEHFTNDCFKESHATILQLENNNGAKKKKHLSLIAEEIADESNIEGFKTLDDNQSKLSEVQIDILENQIEIAAQAKFWFNFKAKMNGTINYDNSSREIIIHITKAKLPMGISSVKMLMYFLKKYTVNKIIRVEGEKVIIQL